MKNKTNYYKESLDILLELKQVYPDQALGMHLSTALDEYGDLWGVSDKEILFALTKYRATLQMDVPRETSNRELEKILRDGMNLTIEDNG